jgi:hypothetical protein
MFFNETRFNGSNRFFKQQRPPFNGVHLKKSAFIFSKWEGRGGFVNNCGSSRSWGHHVEEHRAGAP